MYDFLSMEQSLGMNLDDKTYAEASQMYSERGRETWQHTSTLVAYHVVTTTTNEKDRAALRPDMFNPWEWAKNGIKKGVRLTRENLGILKGLDRGTARSKIRP